MGLFFKNKKKKQDLKADENWVDDDRSAKMFSRLSHESTEPTLDLTQRLDDNPPVELVSTAAEPTIIDRSQVPSLGEIRPSSGDPTRDAMVEQFDQLRRVVEQKKSNATQVPQKAGSQASADQTLDLTDALPEEDSGGSFFSRFGNGKRKKRKQLTEDESGQVVNLITPLASEVAETEPEPEPEPELVISLRDKVSDQTQPSMSSPKEPQVSSQEVIADEILTEEISFGVIERVASEPTPTRPQPVPLADDTLGMDFMKLRLPNAWLGLWVSEDGRSLYIESDDNGGYSVTAMPDPMSKCYFGPDYPEIETWRMPANFVRESIGELDGERLTINSVPGLPAEHRAPFVHLYFLTNVVGDEGGGTRFADAADILTKVYLVTESEAGTVNPWGEDDEILWLGSPANFYKAPAKLDTYLARRMLSEDPSNHI